MKEETILHKGRKVIKKIKDNGDISYTIRGVYIGQDVKTGKKLTASFSASTLRKLEQKINKKQIEFKEQGSTVNPSAIAGTFKDLANLWFDSFKLLVTSQNTINRVKGYLDTYLIPKFGDRKPESIESMEIQLWVNELAINASESVRLRKRKSPKGSTRDFGNIIYKMKEIYDFGITNLGLTYNPVTTIKVPPKPHKENVRINYLNEQELSLWIEYLDSLPDNRTNRRFRLICDTLLASALRINELLALTIDDIDIVRNTINVNKTLVWQAGNKDIGEKGKVIKKDTPKSLSGNRSVSVPKEIIVRLVSFYEEMNEYFERHELPKSKLIFPTIYGNYMTDRNERATLKKRLSSIGLPDYGFHVFRHTHASLMLNAGLNWKELQTRMGHKSISTTMDTYAKLAPEKYEEAVHIFDQKLKEITKK